MCYNCRDLKPENILLSSDMHILITDFGSARILSKNETENVTGKIKIISNSSKMTIKLRCKKIQNYCKGKAK